MRQIVCDRCKKIVSLDNKIVMNVVHYKPGESPVGHDIDLCVDCGDKFYLWLSGGYDENTTETK